MQCTKCEKHLPEETKIYVVSYAVVMPDDDYEREEDTDILCDKCALLLELDLPKKELEYGDYTKENMLDLLLDCIVTACEYKDGLFNHECMEPYEEAFTLLTEAGKIEKIDGRLYKLK